MKSLPQVAAICKELLVAGEKLSGPESSGARGLLDEDPRNLGP